MNAFLKTIGVILSIILFIWDLAELLAVPALLVICGLLNDFGYLYYIISIGAYFLLLLMIELILHFVFKAFNKKHRPILERKLEKFFDRLSKSN